MRLFKTIQTAASVKLFNYKMLNLQLKLVIIYLVTVTVWRVFWVSMENHVARYFRPLVPT